MLLPKYDGNCGWYETLPTISDHPQIENENTFHTVVIGGGFVGMAAVRRLAENLPDDKFLLVEALKVGQGASGRNSGFVIDHPHKRDLETSDHKRMRKIVALNRMAIEYLEKNIHNYSIDCQWSKAGKYQGAVGDRGIKFLEAYQKLLDNFGEDYKYHSRDELKEVIGSSYYKGAIFTPGTVLMQPAALMRGLVDNLPENVVVSEQTPIISISKQNNLFRLETPKSTVLCKSIVLATNAFTAEFGYLKNRLLPVMTFASMTRPLTNTEMKNYAGKLDWGLTPADHAGTTFRMTQDRRLIVRNSYQYAPEVNAPEIVKGQILDAHRASLTARYPHLAEIEFDYSWGGTSTLSGNFETFFGQVDEGVYTACCDQSVGAARGTATGMMLADLIAGKNTEKVTDMIEISGSPTRLPPQWMLRVGVPLRMQLAKLASKTEI